MDWLSLLSWHTALVKQAVPYRLDMLKRTLNNSVKWKLHCSIQIMLWLPGTLSSFLIPNYLLHFDRDLNQLLYKRGCNSSWTCISYFPWITNKLSVIGCLNNSTVFPLFLGLQFFHKVLYFILLSAKAHIPALSLCFWLGTETYNICIALGTMGCVST